VRRPTEAHARLYRAEHSDHLSESPGLRHQSEQAAQRPLQGRLGKARITRTDIELLTQRRPTYLSLR
jgi:hypothetical protein